jgi:hypothetical protein
LTKREEILDLLVAKDRLLPNSKRFIGILQHLKALDRKSNRFYRREL